MFFKYLTIVLFKKFWGEILLLFLRCLLDNYIYQLKYNNVLQTPQLIIISCAF